MGLGRGCRHLRLFGLPGLGHPVNADFAVAASGQQQGHDQPDEASGPAALRREIGLFVIGHDLTLACGFRLTVGCQRHRKCCFARAGGRPRRVFILREQGEDQFWNRSGADVISKRGTSRVSNPKCASGIELLQGGKVGHSAAPIALATVVRMVELRSWPLASLPSGSIRMQAVLPRIPNIPGIVVWLQSPDKAASMSCPVGRQTVRHSFGRHRRCTQGSPACGGAKGVLQLLQHLEVDGAITHAQAPEMKQNKLAAIIRELIAFPSAVLAANDGTGRPILILGRMVSSTTPISSGALTLALPSAGTTTGWFVVPMGRPE